MNKKHNIIILVVFAAIFFTVAAANILQPTRATYSEEEKRELAKFPEFNLESLTSGKFFSGIDSFISDTFIFRNELIQASRKINSLWSASTFFGTGEDEIIFISTDTPIIDVEIDSPIPEINKNEPVKEPDEEPEPTDPVTPDDITEEIPSTEDPDTESIPDETVTEDPTEDKPANDTESPNETPIENENNGDEKNLGDTINTENETDAVEPPPTEEPIPDSGLSDIADPVGVGEPEFLASGHIIYNNAVHSIPYLVPSVAEYYGDVVSYYKYLFPNARVSTLSAPLSSAMLNVPSLKNKITDQNKMINTINSYLSEEINGVNCYEELYSHRNEYLYYKSDHHWTARGAYYAYVAFAESIGLEPTPLENFNEVLMNSKWKGSMYGYTGDERVKEFSDEVYAYVTSKKHTMTTYNSKGVADKFNSSILTGYASYTGFINGDNAYTVISVPENPKDMTILVFKDSYGNAFVPYLVEHYSTIIVVDPRYIYFDIYEHLKDYPLTDILFVNNLYNPNVLSYPKNLMRAIGQ